MCVTLLFLSNCQKNERHQDDKKKYNLVIPKLLTHKQSKRIHSYDRNHQLGTRCNTLCGHKLYIRYIERNSFLSFRPSVHIYRIVQEFWDDSRWQEMRAFYSDDCII
jgi:hypothetical protein